ncbi:GNAT family N-acetyltransferase [Bacillus sp. FJAT-42376]|uniref:GNAT family N-acetyltransferase n=1 Tax=Bacillus sp. FJAT-42376 TaxID=2014076 RepID=UPI001F152B4A|nr:GNAT family N-acetyltransferase [Bacillus sp. FJAT-42376]
MRDGTLGEARPSDEKASKLVQSLLDKGCTYLVAGDGDSFHGWVLIGKGKDSLTDKTFGFVYELYVLEPFRKNGLGRKLMEEAMNQFKSEGYEEVRLSVYAGNHAVLIYEEMGFAPRTLTMNCKI